MMALVCKQRMGRIQTDHGGDQDGFQFIVKIIVYLSSASKQTGQFIADTREAGS